MTPGEPPGADAVGPDDPATGTGRPPAAGWTIFCLLGLAAWIGVTVYVAASNDDASDATPILRTFAIAGAVFFALVLTVAALQLRRRNATVNEGLYRRLAVVAVSPGAVRAAVRRTRRFGHAYLLFAGLTTGLMLTAIGLGEDGPYAVLFAATALLVLGWAGYALYALRTTFRGTDELLAPLGLSIVATPSWVMNLYGGGGRLVGGLSFTGVRHGRQVTINHTPHHSVVVVVGSFPRRALTSAAAMASMTGLPARVWRDVSVRTGGDGVTVRRHGNGAGRWFLHDLLLAEHVAASTPVGRPSAR